MQKLKNLLAAVFLVTSLIVKAEDSIPSKPTSHTIRQIEGWTVRVDDRLISGPERELSQHTLRILSNRLYDIKFILPADKVARLQKVTIQIDLTHGKLTSAQYHPSVDWLKENGYATNLVQCVHIPDASDFSNLNHQRIQPWSVLHELAHAYHDQVLGFEHPGIMAAYQAFKDRGKYNSVLHINGRQTRHYALTDQKEFFAEMTEAFFGANDFFPFNRAELQNEEPALFALLTKIWMSGVKP